MRPKRSLNLRLGMVVAGPRLREAGLDPASDQTADLVNGAGGMLVAAGIEMALLEGKAEEKAQLLQAEIGTREMRAPIARVGRFDQRLEHIEGGRLDPVTEQESL